MDPIALRCTYRHSGYTSDEIDLLKRDLDGIAVLQSRPQGYPAAGNAFDMTLVAQFVGSSILGGVIYDGLKEVGKAVYRFYKRKADSSPYGFPPEIDLFELRFADLDIRLRGKNRENMECNFLSETAFQYLAEIVTAIKQHLDSEPLASTDKMVIDVFEPEVTLDECGSPSFDFRHPWRITGIDIMGPNAYHPTERRLSDEHVRID